jgi:hypothetical protein
MALLLYHPESDSYMLGSPDDLEKDGLLLDVTGVDDHETEAVIRGIDISDVAEHVPEKALGLAGAIAASMAKWARKPADLYPTPPDCVWSLFPHIEDILPPGRHILEPACADGQLSRALLDCGYDVASFDLRPDCGFGTGGMDFLDRENEYKIVEQFEAGFIAKTEYNAVWTNPPFSAAEQFVIRGLEVAPIVILLLKSNYWHTKNRRKLWKAHPPSREYKLTWRPAFLEKERGKSPLMDCSWYVWERSHDGDCITVPIDREERPPSFYGGL